MWNSFEEETPTGQGGAATTFIGGTGRFEGATGSTTQTQSNRVEYNYYDPETDIVYLVIEYDDVVTGTITY